MTMRIFGLVGRSGSGKTTLMERLLPSVRARGLSVSTVKHAHHGFDIDRPGKDSWRHREAGAEEVLLISGGRWALLHEVRDDAEPALEDLLPRLAPVDVVLVEGFHSHGLPSIEVHRPSEGHALMWHPGSPIVAVASDVPIVGLGVPRLDLNRPDAVARFILAHLGLHGTARIAVHN
jgi:molybdopterin-guanine dinucleotide biosynthesis protein B